MHTALFTLVTTVLLTTAAQAEFRIGVGTERMTLKCEPNYVTSGQPMSVTVSEDLRKGTAKINVTRYYNDKAIVKTYAVKKEVSPAIGGATSFVGSGARLTVNFTTTPLDDGGHASTLQLPTKVKNRYTLEKLSCQGVYHTL